MNQFIGEYVLYSVVGSSVALKSRVVGKLLIPWQVVFATDASCNNPIENSCRLLVEEPAAIPQKTRHPCSIPMQAGSCNFRVGIPDFQVFSKSVPVHLIGKHGRSGENGCLNRRSANFTSNCSS